MPRTDSIVRLVDSIYEAALEPQRWEGILKTICQLVRASKATLYWKADGSPDFNLFCTHGIEQEWISAYAQHYAALDEWRIRRAKNRQDDIFTGEMLIPGRELRRSEFGNDFLLPQGCDQLLCVDLAGGTPLESFLSHFRTQHEPEFDKRQTQVLRTLHPHVQRAIRTSWRFADKLKDASAGYAALQRLNFGVLLTTSDGRVLFMNAAAESMIQDQDGLRIIGGRIQGCRGDETSRLASLIASASPSRNIERARIGSEMSIAKERSGQAYSLSVTPLYRMQTPDANRATVLILISDPLRSPTLPAMRLQLLYKLTPAEARLAMALARGASLQTFATERKLSVNTVRFQLRQVLEKTDTKRQAELVRLLLTAAPVRDLP